MVCREVKGHGVGSMEDAEPAHNGLEVRRLVMLVWDSNGCPKSSEEGILVDGVSAVGHQGQPAEDYSLAAILRVLRDVLVEGEHMGLRRPLAGELPTGVAEDVAQGEVIAAAEPEMPRREGVEQVDRSPADEACRVRGMGHAVGPPEGVSGQARDREVHLDGLHAARE